MASKNIDIILNEIYYRVLYFTLAVRMDNYKLALLANRSTNLCVYKELHFIHLKYMQII